MSTLTETLPRASLYYCQGSSNKEYHAAIEPSGSGFVVNFSYGRRGSTLQTGSKTAEPVSLTEAEKIFDKLVREKQAKGYTPGESGTPYQQTQRETRVIGILPQLLNAIDEDTARELLGNRDWWMQEKYDGKRVLLVKSADQITGINRKGLAISLPEPIVQQAHATGGQQWLMDGEAVGDVFVAFDLLEQACINLRPEPYSKRYKALCDIIGPGESGPIRVAPTATTKSQKVGLLGMLRGSNREGAVFKRHAAPYTPGRPASGGNALKLKFTATASCLVVGINGSKRSVALELLDGARRVAVGSVTVPANQEIPPAGAIVDVRYLYAHVGGSLFQPVLLGVRDDISANACTISQLKYKSEGEG